MAVLTRSHLVVIAPWPGCSPLTCRPDREEKWRNICGWPGRPANLSGRRTDWEWWDYRQHLSSGHTGQPATWSESHLDTTPPSSWSETPGLESLPWWPSSGLGSLIAATPELTSRVSTPAASCKDRGSNSPSTTPQVNRTPLSHALDSLKVIDIIYWSFDVSGSPGPNSPREVAYREADVFLLCYKISDISSLFSAINHWVPELRSFAPVTPIILVGCQTDLRGDRQTISSLARQGRSPVSADQARSFSQQAGAVSSVETSAKLSNNGPEAIFQLAAQISLEQVRNQEYNKPSPVSTSTPSNSLERSTESPESFWDQYQYNSPSHRRSNSLFNRSPSLSSSLNSTRSSISIPTVKSPNDLRRNSLTRGKQNICPEKMIKIKCQRLNANKIYEEVEIEVPAPIYETLQASNEISSSNMTGLLKRKESFSSKLKHLFLRN